MSGFIFGAYLPMDRRRFLQSLAVAPIAVTTTAPQAMPPELLPAMYAERYALAAKSAGILHIHGLDVDPELVGKKIVAALKRQWKPGDLPC